MLRSLSTYYQPTSGNWGSSSGLAHRWPDRPAPPRSARRMPRPPPSRCTSRSPALGTLPHPARAATASAIHRRPRYGHRPHRSAAPACPAVETGHPGAGPRSPPRGRRTGCSRWPRAPHRPRGCRAQSSAARPGHRPRAAPRHTYVSAPRRARTPQRRSPCRPRTSSRRPLQHQHGHLAAVCGFDHRRSPTLRPPA